jgi:N-formylglutamate amidohydrolase
VPHAGLFVDPESLATLIAPASSLGRDADLYVDDLYARAPDFGAALLVAHVSRYVCDLNRSEADIDPLAVEAGTARSAPHGLIWRTTTENRPALSRPLRRPELERRIANIYRPYHAALRRLLDQRVARFGYAVLLCAHSMPSRGRDGHTDPGHERADVVPGSRGRTSAAAAYVDLTENVAKSYGFSVAHDDPYKGGYSTAHYGRPTEHVHAVQVELARRLYMDELALTKKAPEFERLQSFCDSMVQRLCEQKPDR